MDYMTGVEVPDFTRVPPDWGRLRIPEHRYVVFEHAGHVSGIRRAWASIWNHWFPTSGHEPADGPAFERYDERFDPQTGNGGLEIWVPLRR
jgi:AraC family transcriptional regulator